MKSAAAVLNIDFEAISTSVLPSRGARADRDATAAWG
jgi:hypothetical protein